LDRSEHNAQVVWVKAPRDPRQQATRGSKPSIGPLHTGKKKPNTAAPFQENAAIRDIVDATRF
jgi:hypothetical protein